MIKTLHKDYTQKRNLLLWGIIASLFFYICIVYFTLEYHKDTFYKYVDKSLKNSAYAIEYFLPEDFHDRAINKDSITKQEDEENIKRLSKFAKNNEIEYLYTMIQKGDKIFFTSSSTTEEDRKEGKVTYYYDEYDQATQKLKSVLQNGKIVYEEASDQWGKFRSVFIPMISKDGHKYILGADIAIDYIDKELNLIVIKGSVFAVIFIVFSIFIFVLRYKIDMKELKFITTVEEKLHEEIQNKTNELLTTNEKLQQLYITDRLTTLYNRYKLDEVLSNEIKRSKRYKNSFGVIILDVDHFKKINDTYGHLVGDSVIIMIASILKESIRDTDTLGRWGGEEFLIICTEANEEGLKILAEKIRKSVEIFNFEEVDNVTISLGLTMYQNNDTDDTILARADNALYNAKHNGRNRIEIL